MIRSSHPSKKKRPRPRSRSASSPYKGKLKTGYLRTHRDGYGFVSFADPEEADVFVPKRRLSGALDGDKVEISVWKNGRDGRYEGEVKQVLERGKRFLIGTLENIKKKWLVVCESASQLLHFVVDQAELKGASQGESVGIEVLTYPLGRLPGQAQVVQLFGVRGEENTEIDIVILKHQLSKDFSEESLQEAQAISRQGPPEAAEAGRVDLRDLELVTIDGESARDFDDAICVKKEGVNYRLWVSIADVSHYVQPASALDKEALARGTSVYFSQKVLAMLPEALSNDLCSLRPGQNRLAMTAELVFDSQGKTLEAKFYPSLIRSQARLTYTQVAAACLAKENKAKEKLKNHLNMLGQAFELYKILKKKRLQQGSLDFDLPEVDLLRSLADGSIESIVKAERNEAHLLIEDLMIAANVAVAQYLGTKKRALLYRVHDQPEATKLKDFALLCHNLGLDFAFKKPLQSSQLATLLKKTKGHAEEKLLHHSLLRSLKQACYATKNLGHFGLAAPDYCHFTSPIRRYPDLVVHRVLKALWAGERPKNLELEVLDRVGDHCSRRERVAMEAEWEARDLEVALFMKKFLGQDFDGHIARVTRFGFFVELEQYFVEGLVAIESLKDDYYRYEEKSFCLIGRRHRRRYRIGQKLKVKVVKVDVELRRVYLEIR